jgi:DNA polymerase V
MQLCKKHEICEKMTDPMIFSRLQLYAADRSSEIARPLILARVAAGFPSPADDFLEGRIDLNTELVPHPLATYYIRVEGDSMIGAGIKPGAILVVDRSVDARSGDIVVARVENEMCVKELEMKNPEKYRLLSRNPAYPPIEITPETDFEVWGRVMYSITRH